MSHGEVTLVSYFDENDFISLFKAVEIHLSISISLMCNLNFFLRAPIFASFLPLSLQLSCKTGCTIHNHIYTLVSLSSVRPPIKSTSLSRSATQNRNPFYLSAITTINSFSFSVTRSPSIYVRLYNQSFSSFAVYTIQDPPDGSGS